MRRFVLAGIAAAAAATLVLSAEPAYALTWNIARPAMNCNAPQPICDITATSPGPLVFTDTKTGTSIVCRDSELIGFLHVGNNVGNILGDIQGPVATPFVGCNAGSFGFGTTGQYTWLIVGTGFAKGVTTGQVGEMNVQFTSGGLNPCSLRITGAASFTYTNATGLWRFLPTVGLKDQLAISGVSAGCGTAFQNSPANSFTATFSGTYDLLWNADQTHPQITAA